MNREEENFLIVAGVIIISAYIYYLYLIGSVLMWGYSVLVTIVPFAKWKFVLTLVLFLVGKTAKDIIRLRGLQENE